MTKECKKAGLALCGGVFLILLGIFWLYMRARYDLPFECLRKGDFYPVSSENLHLIAPFLVIFTGFLTELFGFFQLAKFADNVQIFYNRANTYFLIILFVLIAAKDLMAHNENLFFIKICVSRVEAMGYGPIDTLKAFLLILVVYFLLKDFFYLGRVFKANLPIVTFAACIVCVFAFFSNYILPYEFHDFLKSFNNIQVFVPYLLMCLVTYARILKYPVLHEAKEFSFYGYLAQNKKRAVLILTVTAVFISWISSESSFSTYLFYILLFLPIAGALFLILHFPKISSWKITLFLILVAVLICFIFKDAIAVMYIMTIFVIVAILIGYFLPSTILVSLPLLFFHTQYNKKILLWTVCCVVLLGFAVYYTYGVMRAFYLFILPVSLILCVILKLQQYNFIKTSLALMAATCALFGLLIP
ncbi:MAG: hypothetical protein LBS26_06015 [Campylobacteraceae bacterium]|jgi:hypothetical protein|nr:hypothetical protein [Campylobacteraceae bacterium]